MGPKSVATNRPFVPRVKRATMNLATFNRDGVTVPVPLRPLRILGVLCAVSLCRRAPLVSKSESRRLWRARRQD